MGDHANETEMVASRLLHQMMRGEPQEAVDFRSGETLQNPDFANPTRVHDWRNHVGRRAQAIWETLTPSQKLAIALDAQDAAGNEEWD